jgi:hypothetical protein
MLENILIHWTFRPMESRTTTKVSSYCGVVVALGGQRVGGDHDAGEVQAGQ